MVGYQPPATPYVDLPSQTTAIWAADLNNATAAIANLDCRLLPCDVATTASTALSGTGQTIDTVVVTAGMRIFNKDDATGTNRGVYVAGSGSWARAADLKAGAVFRSGTTVIVTKGSQANREYSIASGSGAQTGTVGSDSLTVTWINNTSGGGSGIPASSFTQAGDLLIGTGVSSFTHKPVGFDGQVLIADSTTGDGTGVRWGATPGHLVAQSGTSVTQRNMLNFVGSGVTVADDPTGSASGGFPSTQVTVNNVFDVNTTLSGYTVINNGFTNYLTNSRFDTWSSLLGLPNGWFINSFNNVTVTQVAGLDTGSSAVQISFTNNGDEFFQVIHGGLHVNDKLTFAVKLERISGTGNIHIDLCRYAFPFNGYADLNPVSGVTIGGGAKWVACSGTVLFAEPMKVQFQATDSNGSTWKIHKAVVQRGQGIINDWAPSVPELAGTVVNAVQHPVDTTGDSGNPDKFNIYGDVPFSRVLMTHDTFVNFMEPIDDNYKEFAVLIEQDSVGGHACYFQPGTIAWAGGIEPHIDPLPNSFSFLRCAWMGTDYGLFVDATTGISAYRRTLPDPYKGNTLGIKILTSRGTTPAGVDNAVNTLLRYTTLAHRNAIGATGKASIQYSGKFSADISPAGAVQRGGGLDFYYGYETPYGAVVYASPIPYIDATVHEYYHAEHDWYFPNGYGPETATSGQFAPYNGQTYKVLLHPLIQSCYYRAYNHTTTRTVSITTTSGSTTITSSAVFVGSDASGHIGGAGIVATGIPAAATRNVTGSITLGFSSVTITSGTFDTSNPSADLGAGISGTGIPTGSFIAAIISSTQAQITQIATGTASGTTYTISRPVQITAVTDSSHATISQAATASGTVTATITYPNGNQSALAEFYSQVRTSMKAHQVGDDAVYGTVLQSCGNDSTVVTDFQNFVTHVGYAGG